MGKKALALLAPEFKNPIMTELGRTTRDFVQFSHAVSGTKIVVTVARMSSAWKEQNRNVSGAVSGEGCDPQHRVLYCCSGTPRGWSPSSESRLILSSVSFLSVFFFLSPSSSISMSLELVNILWMTGLIVRLTASYACLISQTSRPTKKLAGAYAFSFLKTNTQHPKFENANYFSLRIN